MNATITWATCWIEHVDDTTGDNTIVLTTAEPTNAPSPDQLIRDDVIDTVCVQANEDAAAWDRAAERRLSEVGWQVTGEWQIVDQIAFAPVRPA